MQLEEMKKLYATGDYIAIGYIITDYYNEWAVFGKPDFSITNIVNEWKLIHRKDADILDHMLNGGLVKVTEIKADGIAENVLKGSEAIEYYNESYEYQILKPKPVERITRVEIEEGQALCNKIQKYIEYLEANQKEAK